VASSVNLSVVVDCDAAVVLVPSGIDVPSPFGDAPVAEISSFPGAAFGVFADDDSLNAFGPNALDPACRIGSAKAGREQGRREAEAIARFLDV
jgi:NTE family protein